MKTLIVDDHAMIRTGLKQICADKATTLLEADTGEAALTLQKSERPQLTILDLNMPGLGGLELLSRLLEADPAARVLVFSMHDEPLYAGKALEIGAKGYVSKNASPEELRTAISRVGSGFSYVEDDIAQQLAIMPAEQRQKLTERDLEILRLLGIGRSFSEIAQQLGVSYKTIANTATSIKFKLGVTRTADLIRLSVDMALIGKQHAESA